MQIKSLSLEDFKKSLNDRVLVDTRIPDKFERGFIPGSISVGIGGPLKEKVSRLVKPGTPLAVVADDMDESLAMFHATGYEDCVFLEGGFETWRESGEEVDLIIGISAEEFELDLNYREERVIDVREPIKYGSGHVMGAENIPFDEIGNASESWDKDSTIYLYCGGGYSSIIACSVLRKNGFFKLKNVWGGLPAIEKTRIPVVKAKS